jgi:hypothetical protein
MAILKNSILGQISGKLGGMIFRSNQFGTHIYTAPNAINKNSDAQNLVRATLGAPTQKFTDLGISDRQAWNQFAANSFSNCRKKGAPSKKGYLVYKSCITTRQLMNLYFHDFNVYLSDGYSHLPAIVTNLGYPSTAPIAMISPFIISNSSQGTKTYFQNCVLSRAGLSSFFINILASAKSCEFGLIISR